MMRHIHLLVDSSTNSGKYFDSIMKRLRKKYQSFNKNVKQHN